MLTLLIPSFRFGLHAASLELAARTSVRVVDVTTKRTTTTKPFLAGPLAGIDELDAAGFALDRVGVFEYRTPTRGSALSWRPDADRRGGRESLEGRPAHSLLPVALGYQVAWTGGKGRGPGAMPATGRAAAPRRGLRPPELPPRALPLGRPPSQATARRRPAFSVQLASQCLP
jgi:hypothetical protein